MSTLLRRCIFWVILLLACWLSGLMWFAYQLPANNKNIPNADAIIVLTGGKNRLNYGLELLAENKAPDLFITGVHEKITAPDLLNLAPGILRDRIAKRVDKHVILGRKAWNTIGNAEETSTWLQNRNIKHIILVTSNYHMPRSLQEFRYYIPNVKITAAPVPVKAYNPISWWLSNHYRRLVFSEFHKYLVSRLRQAIMPILLEYS